MIYHPEVEERNSALHRTLVEFLLHSGNPEIAAAILEGWVDTEGTGGDQIFFVEIPPAS